MYATAALSALCILALVAAACLAPALPGTGVQGIEPGGIQERPTPDQLMNTQGLPPDAAIASCSGKTTGDTCRFADRDGTVSGSCDEKPGVLACAPDRTGPGDQVPGTMTEPQVTAPVLAQSQTRASVTLPVISPAATGTFVLSSNAGPDGGTLPDEYSCDGAGASPALSWSGAPAGTEEFALMMTTIPVDGSTRWNWVLYHIPASATGIARNDSAAGITGTGSHGTVMQYDPPCSQGPGAKQYTLTLYALSASPDLPADPAEVTGPVLTSAIAAKTLDRAVLNLYHERAAESP